MAVPLPRQDPPGAGELDRAVREVLARPEFAERELPGPLRWLVDRYDEVREAIWRELLAVADWGETAPVLYWGIVILMVAAALAILVRLGSVAVRAWRARDRGRDPGVPEEAAEAPGPRRADAWEARAAAAAEEGRLREAALALYRAVVLRLDERGAVAYDPSKTPGDYRRETPGGGSTGRALRGFLRRFEPVAFGGRAVSAADYEGLAAAARRAGARV